MDSIPSQSVAIDGHSVRRIREEKRLTQLYVAKVVGVTTDTVSRWENNRYPTIRRDNALNLAEALEVELDDILKHDLENEASLAELSRESRNVYTSVITGVALLVILIAAILLWVRLQPGVSPLIQARRIVPNFGADGSRILIQVQISSEKPLKGMILKEKFPPGWQMIDSVPVASSVEAEAGGARWIFRNPAQEMKVYYLLRIDQRDGVNEAAQISGEVIANPDGSHTVVALEQVGRIKVKPRHWADRNGDLVIDDLEILAVSELTETTGDLDLEWDLIEEIWEEGSYSWDPEKKVFTPTPQPND